MSPGFIGILWLCINIIMSSQTNAEDFVGILTGDDNLAVFADGRLVGYNGGTWNAARWLSFPSETKVITVFVYNGPNGFGGFLGVFSNGVVTDSSWKCNESSITPDDGWQQTNFSDNTWPSAFVRHDNSGRRISTHVIGIPNYVHWISAENHYVTRFICRRRISKEERFRKGTLVTILAKESRQTIKLYLDGVLSGKAVGDLTVVRDQYELLAVNVEDEIVYNKVNFVASSSNGFRTNRSLKCTNKHQQGWILPNFNDTSWPNPYADDNNKEVHFVAPDAKWITYLPTTSNIIFCRWNTIAAEVQNATSSPKTSTEWISPNTISLSTLVIVLIAIGGVTASVVIGLAVFGYIWRKRRQNNEYNLQLKDQPKDKWEINSNDVTIYEELGHGAFGKVCKGIMKASSGMKRRQSTITVAVKMLQDNATPEQVNDFLEEITLMKAVGSHKNIVNLIGCCTKSSPNFLIVEYAAKGDLLSYLKERRKKHHEPVVNDIGEVNIALQKTDGRIDVRIKSAHPLNDEEQGVGDEENDSLTPQDMMSFSWQIAQGMQYLSAKGIVHRDLAARNVLLCDNKLVKVADFGLARSTLGENVYHMTGQRNKLPVKWMSPEAINDGVFTTKSDVWSYGVLLWEIATLGGFPYPGIKNRELMRLLRRGYRMEKPDTCSEEFYQLMRRCWADDPDTRPTFAELYQELEDWMQREVPYLDMDQLDEDQPYYDASVVSLSSGSSSEVHAPGESLPSNTDTDNLALDGNQVTSF